MKNKSEISTRVWICFLFLGVLGLAILTKIFTIQFTQTDKWEELGNRYEQQIKPILPTRGQIYSSDNQLLATSVPEYDIRWDSKCEGLTEEMFAENVDSIAFLLSDLFKDKSQTEYRRLLEEAKRTGNRYALIRRDLDHNQAQLVKQFPLIRRGRYKSGFQFPKTEIRKKPFGKLASRTIGIEREGAKIGLERAYNDELAGKEGQQLQEKIAGNVWKPITDDFIQEPVEGLDLYSSIDIHLQDVMENALEKQLLEHQAVWGCAILMEVETGYVRAIANLAKDEEEGIYYEDYNHAIATSVEPGSTFKLPMIMTALEEGLVHPTDSMDTGNGIIEYYKKRIRDSNWDKGGHGKITVEQVFEMSSNVGMAKIIDQCYKQDKQRFLDQLAKFGLYDSLDISIKGEVNPKIYRKVGDDDWSGISHVQMAIGYEVSQTPLQTLAFFNAVANEGRMMKPIFAESLRRNGEIIETIEPVVLKDRICSINTLQVVREMMEGVCQEHGTADYVFEDAKYPAAGKTGTAWLYENGQYIYGRYRGSFAGYFPADDPKYSCIVVINDPRSGVYYGSSIAAPVFKEVADHIYTTKLEFSEADTTLLAEAKLLPISRNGHSQKLQTAMAGMGIKVELNTEATWVATSTGADQVSMDERAIQKSQIPNVKGMGLQDALFLLESKGLRVRAVGIGTVKKQSIPAGSPAIKGNEITLELG